MKVDRETGKVVLKPCLFVTKSQRLRLCRVTKSRTRATKSRDKIAADIGHKVKLFVYDSIY